MLTNSHSHHIHAGDVNTIFNIRLNEQPLSLPHGPNLRFTAGIHPWDVIHFREQWFENLTMLMNFSQLVGIGECGLDKNCDTSFELQQEIFVRQIELATILKKPLIIHCVGYFNELILLMRQTGFSGKAVIHGFRGKPELARQLLTEGFYLSFGPHYNPESVAVTPIDRILIETDESETAIETVFSNIAMIKNCETTAFTASRELFGI